MKNRRVYQHPAEAMEFTLRTHEIPWNVKRKSDEKRPNELYYNLGNDREFEDSEEGTDVSEVDESEVDESEVNGSDNDEINVRGTYVAPVDNDAVNGANDGRQVNDGALDNTENAETNILNLRAYSLVSFQDECTSDSRSTGLYGRSCRNMSRYIKVRSRFHPGNKIPDPSSIICSGIRLNFI